MHPSEKSRESIIAYAQDKAWQADVKKLKAEGTMPPPLPFPTWWEKWRKGESAL